MRKHPANVGVVSLSTKQQKERTKELELKRLKEGGKAEEQGESEREVFSKKAEVFGVGKQKKSDKE